MGMDYVRNRLVGWASHLVEMVMQIKKVIQPVPLPGFDRWHKCRAKLEESR